MTPRVNNSTLLLLTLDDTIWFCVKLLWIKKLFESCPSILKQEMLSEIRHSTCIITCEYDSALIYIVS